MTEQPLGQTQNLRVRQLAENALLGAERLPKVAECREQSREPNGRDGSMEGFPWAVGGIVLIAKV